MGLAGVVFWVEWGGEGAVEDGGGESLGSGATRTWPPPWPPRELPPPKG